MGNIMEGTHGAGEASKTGQPGGGVHGVLHRMRALDLARLTHMEHEYRSATYATCSVRLVRKMAAAHLQGPSWK